MLPSEMEVRFEAPRLRSECELTKEERPSHVASREGVVASIELQGRRRALREGKARIPTELFFKNQVISYIKIMTRLYANSNSIENYLVH